MHCDACGTENRTDRRFCGQCGNPLLPACPECGFKNDSSDLFCGGCGHSLNAVTAETGRHPEQSRSTPADPVSENLAADSEAEHRQLTVMFCDLADSTAMSTRLDPEELSRINRLYQETCSTVISEFDGFIARYMGDGILCYFGYPKAHENDAERAIRAGLKLQTRIAQLNASPETSEPMFVRVGIATGPVVVGEVVGSGVARESTAVGKTPNLAARLQSEAEPGCIVIADETKSLAGELFNYRNLDQLALKGLEQPVPAWEVESAVTASSRFEAASSHQLTPFVGRRHELALLEDCWQQAKSGRGQVVMLCGEAGIGKSRLIQTATGFDRDRSRILQCSPHHQSSALNPIIEFLRAQEPAYQSSDKYWLTQLLESHGIDNDDAEPLLQQLLYGKSNPKQQLFSAQLQKQRTIEVINQILTGGPGGDPWILVIEDLHWVDATTRELINNLVFSVADSPILMLLSFRPEYNQTWMDHSHVHLLTLNRINPDQCRDMIRSLLGSELSEEMARKIVNRTDGIPLFVEELTRTILSSQDNSGVVVEDMDIPGTLADSLNARLDSLGPARRAAQAAAIIGRSFGRALLGAITRLNDDELDQQLEALVTSGLVYRLGDGDSAKFQFKHALIQDAAYASLLSERRASFHKRAALYLEELYQQGHKLADLLSYHFIRAGLFEQGLRYTKEAGDTALSTSAVIEALDHYQNALQVLPQAGDTSDTSSVELKLHLGIAACYRYQEHYDNALECLAQAETLALASNDINALSDLCHTRGNIHFPLGNIEDCLNEHNRSLDYAKQTGSLEKEARAIGGLGDAYYVRGNMVTATSKFSECCQLASNHGFTEQYAANLAMIGWSCVYQLEFPQALQNGLDAIEICRQCDHLRGELNAQALLTFVYGELCEPELALEHADQASALAQKLGAQNFDAAVKAFSVQSMEDHAQRTSVYKIMSEALATSREFGDGFHGPAILGRLLLVSDDSTERESIIAEAESILHTGCVGHNFYQFYRDAIQSALNNREWNNLQRYRHSLATYEYSPLSAWSQFYLARSEVLEDVYREQITESTLERRQQLTKTGRQHKMIRSLLELESIKI